MPTTQVSFSRINPQAPTHLLQPDELITAKNIDLSLGAGAVVVRRGVDVFGTVTASIPITGIARSYNNSNDISAGKFYAKDANGVIYRGSGNSWTSLGTGGNAEGFSINFYQQYALIGETTINIKDDGTLTTEWIKQSPGTPAITVNTLAELDLLFGTATFAVTEGTAVGGTTTITAAPSAAGRVTLTVDFGGSKDLGTNSGVAIGDYGVHFVDLAFDNPQFIAKISQDYSIGDGNFYNYWHSELSPQDINLESGQADALALVDGQANLGTSSTPLSRADRESMISALRDNPRTSLSLITRIADTLAPWGVPRTAFSFVGSDPNAGGTSPWSSIYAVRYTFETSGVVQVIAANPTLDGADSYPLTDLDIGYAWWQTYASFDSAGNKVGESAPSPSTGRVRMQNASAKVALTGTATGTIHGITHVITYRQGGYTRDAYAVNTASYVGTATFTDSMADLKALSLDFPMPRGINSRTEFGLISQAISAPWNDRVFVANARDLHWTLPGQLDAFARDGYLEVGPVGDNIKALIPWNPGLVIINQYSVYEFQGGDLENGDFRLVRSGSKHGSLSPKVPCVTPYGIPLINYDGLTMYVPGQGETEIEWLVEGYGDMFRGDGAFDPAAYKGARIPAISRSYLPQACACYADNKLYLAVPTDSTTTNNTVFVIDFSSKRVWWYQYGFRISSLFWDYQDSRIFAGTTDGRIMRLEINTFDFTTTGTLTPIQWYARSRAWSAASDTILQNVAVDGQSSGGPILIQGFYDDPVSPTVGTLTNTTRAWQHLPLDGSFVRSAEFLFSGTTTGTGIQAIYQLSFDSIADPQRVRFFRTPYDDQGSPNIKLWDLANYSVEVIGTGTVRAVTFVDTTAVMTHTITGPTNGRVWQDQSFPAVTRGKLAYTTYTATDTSVLFKVWDGDNRFVGRPEPPQVNDYRTNIESLDEAICDAFDTDINPNGTATATIFIDNTATTTATFTGTERQSYTTTIPVETYGRTLYVKYSGSGFQLYNTWFHKRPEPDRWTSYVSTKHSGPEHEWKAFYPEIVCYNTGTCTATVVIDGTAVSTHTMSGVTRQQYAFSIPYASFGRTIWAVYTASAGSTFKVYSDTAEVFEGTPEPPRLTTVRVGPFPLKAESHLKTWLPELDPLGGIILGTFYINGTATLTQSFTGNGRQSYNIGLDLDLSNNTQDAQTWEARYSAAPGLLKHYSSDIESEINPYQKLTWAFFYKKLGGNSQIDLPRFWALQYISHATSTCTYWWDIDGVNHHTGTLTLTEGHGFRDRINFQPGGWGRIFQLRLRFSTPVGVDAVNVDLVQEGVKALSRHGVRGTPE